MDDDKRQKFISWIISLTGVLQTFFSHSASLQYMSLEKRRFLQDLKDFLFFMAAASIEKDLRNRKNGRTPKPYRRKSSSRYSPYPLRKAKRSEGRNTLASTELPPIRFCSNCKQTGHSMETCVNLPKCYSCWGSHLTAHCPYLDSDVEEQTPAAAAANGEEIIGETGNAGEAANVGGAEQGANAGEAANANEQPGPYRDFNMQCGFCGKHGHGYFDCYLRRNRHRITCFRCGKIGHVAATCPNKM